MGHPPPPIPRSIAAPRAAGDSQPSDRQAQVHKIDGSTAATRMDTAREKGRSTRMCYSDCLDHGDAIYKEVGEMLAHTFDFNAVQINRNDH